MSANRATGADDPALAETAWPLPSDSIVGRLHETAEAFASVDGSTESMLLLDAASIVAAYRALIEDGTTAQQLRRLAALRRVHRRRSRR